MKILRKVGILCAALAVAFCVSAQTKLSDMFPEVQTPPERIYLKVFSFVPLNEEGWVITQRSANGLILSKIGQTPEESIVIRAFFFKLPPFKTNEEFFRLFKEAGVKNINPERLRIIKNEVVTYPKEGTDCAKSHVVLEDNAAAKRVGKTGIMMQETLAIYCAHPKDKGIGISIFYSHRYYPDQRDSGFLDKSTSVFDSVEFVDLSVTGQPKKRVEKETDFIKNERYNIQFSKMASDWDKKENLTFKNIYRFINIHRKATIWIRAVKYEFKSTLKESAVSWMHNMENKYEWKNVITVGERETILDGKNAYWRYYRYKMHSSSDIYEKIYLVNINKTMYQFRISAIGINTYRETKNDFENLVHSIKFTDNAFGE